MKHMLLLWTINECFVETLSAAARFVLIEEAKTWEDANDHCASTFGSSLATALDASEMDALSALRSSVGSNLWIGLNDIDEEGTWRWASGFECDGDCTEESWWLGGEPSGNRYGNEDCAEVRDPRALLNDEPCGTDLKFVCDGFPISVPTLEPTNPTADPTAPTSDPTAPTSDPTAPTSDPTAPTSDPTAPTSDPTAPTSDPTAPTADPTSPTSVPTAPTSDPTAPTADPTAPTSELSWHGWGGRELNECEGDCDNDDHCAAGLYCYHDAGVNMNGPPPGCTGTAFTEKADYCFKVPASTGELVWFSWYQTGGLNACQGDCDNDDDCSGDLECYHNAGKKGVDVPGCTGTPTVTSGGEDYCYDPNYELGVAAAAGFASGHSDDEPAEDMEPDHAASDEEAVNFYDFIMMMVGAAIGVMVVAGIVAFVVLMKRKRSGKKEETEMAKVVHVPEASPASVDGVETI